MTPAVSSTLRGLTFACAALAVVASTACGPSRLVPFHRYDASSIVTPDAGMPDVPMDVAVDQPAPPVDTSAEMSVDLLMDLATDPVDGDGAIVGGCLALPLVGFAKHDPGTTGGAGGLTRPVSTYDALVTAANAAERLIIEIGTLIEAPAGASPIRVAANKTIRGIAKNAGLTGIGLNVFRTNNIIIQNLVITKVATEDAVTVNESKNVWIDHCDLSMSNDGLADVNHGSDYVTISWNHLHDQQLASLVGHTAAPENVEDPDHLTVTYHHNWFHGTLYYNPKVRYGKVHIFNNLYDYPVGSDVKGIVAQLGAQVVVENNFFRNVKLPMTTKDSESETDPSREGAITSIGNKYDGFGDSTITRTSTWMPTPSDYSYTLEDAADIKDSVPLCSGPTFK